MNIQGEVKRTDWFIRNLYVKKGFFTPPFETAASLRERLKGMYQDVDVRTVKSEGSFVCRKAF